MFNISTYQWSSIRCTTMEELDYVEPVNVYGWSDNFTKDRGLPKICHLHRLSLIRKAYNLFDNRYMWKNKDRGFQRKAANEFQDSGQ